MRLPANLRLYRDHDLVHSNWYEFPSEQPEQAEAWCYTDRMSYRPGETLRVHAIAWPGRVDLEILRDEPEPVMVHRAENLPAPWQATPVRCSVDGCDWPVVYEWQLPADLPSGGYLLRCRTRDAQGREDLHEHWFALRAPADRAAPILLVCATSTWLAYNNWGGSNHYEGNWQGEAQNLPAPVISTQRPWARGQVSLPIGAPRLPHAVPPEIGAAPRYEAFEWAWFKGYSKYYAAAGWASYERHFLHWALRNGYALDLATQHDLHYDPELLAPYRCVVVVGHDEYWSAEMRDQVDAYVDSGGKVARFGANFMWQVRLQDEGRQQVCYKYSAAEADPLAASEPARMTGAWEDRRVGRPGALTFGLNAINGIYVGVGGFNPRHCMGYTVYRPEHWVFAGTDLYFGDTFGSSARIFAYEVDGVDFDFEHGRPHPTGRDGAPSTLQILAMGASSNLEEDHGNAGTRLYVADGDLRYAASAKDGDDARLEQHRYGAGMLAAFTRGQGEVVNAGSVEWVNGLRLREPVTERITRNILDRFSGRS